MRWSEVETCHITQKLHPGPVESKSEVDYQGDYLMFKLKLAQIGSWTSWFIWHCSIFFHAQILGKLTTLVVRVPFASIPAPRAKLHTRGRTVPRFATTQALSKPALTHSWAIVRNWRRHKLYKSDCPRKKKRNLNWSEMMEKERKNRHSFFRNIENLPTGLIRKPLKICALSCNLDSQLMFFFNNFRLVFRTELKELVSRTELRGLNPSTILQRGHRKTTV